MAAEAERTGQPGSVTGGGVLVAAAQVLWDVASYGLGSDPRRAEVTAAQAGLLEACARHWGELPADVAVRAARVAAAVDRATGRRVIGV
jgi:hypothetical protein